MGGVVARIAAELVSRCRELTRQVNARERERGALVRESAPALLEVPGCGVLSAAVIVGETAGVSRFRSRDAFARFTGTVPVSVWSGNLRWVRLDRGGNRSVGPQSRRALKVLMERHGRSRAQQPDPVR
jgi:transposase